MTQSVQSHVQNSQDQSNSRNGTGQKHFESLKQKIRGVFDHHPDSLSLQSVASAQKTPLKGSNVQPKKSVNQNALLQNRMSLESNPASIVSSGQMLLVMPNSSTNLQAHPLPLSSTAANGRQLSFSSQNQGSF